MKSLKVAVALASAGAGLLVFLANAAPTASDAADLLASESELTKLTGAEPARCVYAGPDRKLCGWSISGRLLRANGTDAEALAERVELICELPVTPALAENDGRGPCRTHAVGLRSDEKRTELPHVSATGGPAEREAVWRRLSAARNVTALSHLIGDVPDSCRVRLLSGQQRCEWKLPEDHRLLAALAPEEGRGVLHCSLPLDGSDREPTSCGVVRLD